MSRPKIFIGMPAYNGKAFIAETLASIRAQSCADYRVLVSIDGDDRETADQCRPFLCDPRFAIRMQQQRLGWEGNFNWLLSQADCEFFCYWQQDDLTTRDYLEALLSAAHDHPAAACCYSDIEWFGETKGSYVEESVTGSPLNRALSIFERLNGIPNRGLIPRFVIERAGPVASNRFGSAFEEYVWIAKLAREGDLLRVPGPTYYKRAHADATSAKWLRKPRAWKRQVWIEFGLGILETVWPLVGPEDRLSTFGIVLDRLCNARTGRSMLYDGATAPFAFDFLEAALKEYPVPELSRMLRSGGRVPQFAGQPAANVVDAVAGWISGGQIPPLAAERIAGFSFGQAGVDLLGEGWSWAEDWGTWSIARTATVALPPRRGAKLKLSFVAFGRQGSSPTINVSGAGRRIASWQVPALAPVTRELSVPGGIEHLVFEMPDAISPAAIEFNPDERLLGIGLVSLDQGG